MRITQGTFSYLPDLDDDEIRAQVQYAIDQGWSLAVEFTDDPHPRNVYWEMWGLPMFEIADGAAVLQEVNRCREAFPSQYIKVTAYDASLGRQTTALSFIVQRPPFEPKETVATCVTPPPPARRRVCRSDSRRRTCPFILPR